jgi:homoserine O-succinyltransferase
MPVNLPAELPAVETLNSENVFVMTKKQAQSQDIRPLKIGIVNLMPTKIETETQLLRMLSNTPLQVEIVLLQMSSHTSKNTSKEHIDAFYQTFDTIKENVLDGLIITGAPIETLPFEKVTYWRELCKIMEWSKTHVYSTMHICWGAQAGLYYHYGVPKFELGEKMSGVFPHRVLIPTCRLTRGFDDPFFAPHSRYTSVHSDDVKKTGLIIVSESEEAGLYIAASENRRQVFVTGHAEYDQHTLDTEYRRDIKKGLKIDPPINYYPHNDPKKPPEMRWRAHAHLLFANWLNYYVYQEVPYNLQGGFKP